MLSVSDLCQPPTYPKRTGQTYCLSIVHRCQGHGIVSVLQTIERLQIPARYAIEHIVVHHPDPQNAPDVPDQFPQQAATQIAKHVSQLSSNIQIVACSPDPSLPAVSYNYGLLASCGRWVWLWEPHSVFASSDIIELAETLSRLAIDAQSAPHTQLLVLQPPGDPNRQPSGVSNQQPSGDLNQATALTIDQLYNGLCPALDSLIWRTTLFDDWGCFDPHLAVREWFTYEMLVRIVRHSRLTSLPTRDGSPAVCMPDRLVDIVLYADSQTTHPRFSSLAAYLVDDLSQVEQKHGPHLAWRLYLNTVLPYLYANRHCLPPSLFIAPQSVPRERISAVFTKVQYETSNELTFWNYERHFSGQRRIGLSYLQSAMLQTPADQADYGHQQPLDMRRTGTVDVLVATRTADALHTQLLETVEATPTAYLLDDDLLTFSEYGDGFAEFRPGNPHYDAMVQAIQAVDTVIGFSPQIAHSTATLNLRYVQSEDSIPGELLPENAAKTTRSAVFHFAYAGGSYRTAEFALLRPAIQQILTEYGDTVRFSFWGFNPETLQLTGNIAFAPFSVHYGEYLGRLRTAGFDAMLVPLLSEPSPKKAKNPNKFLETTVANAVGLYSDVPSYSIVTHNEMGFKVPETSHAWYAAMKAVIEMPEAERTTLRQTALAYVRLFYTTTALAWTQEYGLLAAQLHYKTRAKRLADGRPMLAFFFPCITGTGGGEIQLWRRFALAEQLGFRLFVVISSAWTDSADAARVKTALTERGVGFEFVLYDALFTTPENDHILPSQGELTALRDFFTRYADQISLVHSLAFLPAVGQVCTEFGIPHLASIYGIDDDYEFPHGRLPFQYCDLIQSDSIRYAQKWSRLLACDWICARENVPAEIFTLGFQRLYAAPAPALPHVRLSMAGTFMQRKSQLEVLRALLCLDTSIRDRISLNLFGDVDVYPDYGSACRQAKQHAETAGVAVTFHGHVRDISKIYQVTDIMLSVSSFESFPSAIKESTAAGCLVIASRAGGIQEMMRDGVNCFLVESLTPAAIAEVITRAVILPAPTRLQMCRNAYQLAYEEFHPRRTLYDLAVCYNLSFDVCQAHQSERERPLAPQSIPADQANPYTTDRASPTFETQLPALPPITHTRLDPVLVYSLVPQQAYWARLDILIGTHRRRAAGTMQVRILNPSGQCVRETVAPLGTIPDNSWLSFQFAPIRNAAQQCFHIELRLQNAGPQTCLSVYEDRPFATHYQRLLRRIGQRLGLQRPSPGLYCRLGYHQPPDQNQIQDQIQAQIQEPAVTRQETA